MRTFRRVPLRRCARGTWSFTRRRPRLVWRAILTVASGLRRLAAAARPLVTTTSPVQKSVTPVGQLIGSDSVAPFGAGTVAGALGFGVVTVSGVRANVSSAPSLV